MKTKIKSTETYQDPLEWWGKTQEKATQLARWMSLYEAVNLIADKADEKNVSLEDVEISPLDVRDYMEATQDIFLKKILENDYKIQICYSEDAPLDMQEALGLVDVELKN